MTKFGMVAIGLVCGLSGWLAGHFHAPECMNTSLGYSLQSTPPAPSSCAIVIGRDDAIEGIECHEWERQF